MTNDKEFDIVNELENIDIALETIKGAMLDIDRAKAQIHDILNGTTGDELFRLDQDADARSLSEAPRN